MLMKIIFTKFFLQLIMMFFIQKYATIYFKEYVLFHINKAIMDNLIVMFRKKKFVLNLQLDT